MMVIWIAVLALLASACAGHPATSPGGPAPGVLANASPAGSAGGAGPAVSGSAPRRSRPCPRTCPRLRRVRCRSCTTTASRLRRRTTHRGPAHARRPLSTMTVVPTAFAAQLNWLISHGYTTILSRDLAAYWDRGVPLPVRPVILPSTRAGRTGLAPCCRCSRREAWSPSSTSPLRRSATATSPGPRLRHSPRQAMESAPMTFTTPAGRVGPGSAGRINRNDVR